MASGSTILRFIDLQAEFLLHKLGDVLGGHGSVEAAVLRARRGQLERAAVDARLQLGGRGLLLALFVLFRRLFVLHVVEGLHVGGLRQLLRQQEIADVSVRRVDDVAFFFQGP